MKKNDDYGKIHRLIFLGRSKPEPKWKDALEWCVVVGLFLFSIYLWYFYI
jgi:hypothetical protein